MNEQDKQLLLRDICARLPYNVKGVVAGEDDCVITALDIAEDRAIMPYLRPMSSMTQDECRQLFMLLPTYYCVFQDRINTTSLGSKILPEHIEIITDFYNSHHLDWRGLIPKALALEAPIGTYNI